MFRDPFRPLLRCLAVAFLLAGLTLPAARAQFIATYSAIDPTRADEAVGYDSFATQFVLAGLNKLSETLPTSDLALVVILRGSAGATQYTYLADFLTLKNSQWEMVAVVPQQKSYAVFLNHYHTLTHVWSSYVVFASRTNPTSASALHLEGTGGQQIRLRGAVPLKSSWAVLGSLDGGGPSGTGSPTFLGVISATAVSWAKSYPFRDPIELGSLTRDGSYLVAGGWYSDFDSPSVAQAAMLKVSSTNGAVVQAKAYVDTYTWLTMPIEANAITGGDGLIHAVGTTGGFKTPYNLTFFTVDDNLDPVSATRVYTGTELIPFDLATAKGGVDLAIASDSSVPHQLVRLDGASPTPSAQLYDFDTVQGGWQGSYLRMIDQGSLFPVLTGRLLLTQGSNHDRTMVAKLDSTGHPDYCAESEDLPAPEAVHIESRTLVTPAAVAVGIATDRPAIYGYGPFDTDEEHVCH